MARQDQGVDSHFRPALALNASPVIPPIRRGNAFEIRPGCLGILPHFFGRATEEPYTHLSEYEATCGTIGGQGFTTNEYLPPHKTNESRAVIKDFRQQSGEPFYEALKRFKELLRNCPHHGIEKWELIHAFYDGLLPDDVRDVNSTSNGSFLSNHVDDDWDILERMAVTSKRQTHASRRAKNGASDKAVDYETQKHLDVMELQMSRLGRSGGKEVSNVSQGYPVCDGCGDLGHTLANCPREQGKAEEVNHLGGERRQQDTNATHSRDSEITRTSGMDNHKNNNTKTANKDTIRADIRGTKSNQGYQQGYQRNYQQQNQQSGTTGSEELGGNQFNAFMDAIKGLKKENEDTFSELRKDNEVRDKTVNALSKQVGQLAEEMSKRDPGKLPSNTQTNPQHQGASSSGSKNSYVSAVSTHEDNEESESKDDGEQGEPIIQAKIGGLKIDQALLDYGASVSILPGSLYDRSDFGPLQEVDTTVVLADLTRKRARGMIRGIDVQVAEFYYPEYFLVLEYAPNVKEKQARVILGRPFLATANAQINCRENTVLLISVLLVPQWMRVA
ncbi:hypothetical protein L1987_29625 [Smallanthus sonchifolius]|uniref:Uncharacterized protein n=1 Tax=Smallanthus sonchifolius TaxID=185202 RepID=A0ACB9HZX3_9ASTR|nr:hypothetical protein L1987_29625 [Smallanthus sonchifolius]